MTANSQLVSVKLFQSLARRGLIRLSRQSNQERIRIIKEFYKRSFDIFFSACVLIICSPIYILLAIFVHLSSPGPIFYTQERVGKNFKRFKCIKFRTMIINADQELARLLAESPETRREFEETFKLKNDPRITWIGKFLRLTSLDELPQFWNVLMGDMSVVGPRPLVPEEIYKYGNKMERVLTIKPGITGLWQVSGRNDIPYSQRVLIDVYYVKHHNPLLDLWIVIKTVGVVLFPENSGAY
jgi:lipopolysaccharide/colanic/teichoic acid biosynthesis glycosyltransferase